MLFRGYVTDFSRYMRKIKNISKKYFCPYVEKTALKLCKTNKHISIFFWKLTG